MTPDDALASLRARPRPSLRPFFAARVAQRLNAGERRRTPLLLRLYWIAFGGFAATLLLPTPIGIPLAVIVAAIAVFPERIAAVASTLVRE